MSQQNINQYKYRKLFVKPHRQIFDISIASDERDYNEEVIFSNQLIGVNDGNKLPIHFDLNNSGSSQFISLNYGDYNTGNTLVSLNYYNPNNENLNCLTASTLCDIGLTGIDNGLTTEISGQTLYYTMGLFTGTSKWDRYHFDRRFKLIPITSYTNTPITLLLSAQYSPGSIIVNYNLISDSILFESVTLTFTNILEITGGENILINTGITINSGNNSGTTQVIINENFNNWSRVSTFSGFSPNTDGSLYTFNVTPNIIIPTLTPTPTPSQTPEVTPTPTISQTPEVTPTPTISQTPEVTPSMTNTPLATGITPNPTETQTPTPTNTETITPSVTITSSSTITPTPTNTETITPSVTITPSYTSSQTVTPSDTITPTPTNTGTITPSVTVTPSYTSSQTVTLTPSNTITLTPTNTQTLTPTITQTNEPIQTPTQTITPSNTVTLSITPSFTPSLTRSNTPTQTLTRTVTKTSVTPTPTITSTITSTPTQTSLTFSADSIYNLLSASGKTSYQNAVLGNFIQVSELDYVNVLNGLSGATTYGPTFDQFTGTTNSEWGPVSFISDSTQSSLPPNNYIVGFAVRAARYLSGQQFYTVNVYQTTGTVSGGTYTGITNNISFTNPSAGAKTYFIRKSPQTAIGSTTYLGLYSSGNITQLDLTTRLQYYSGSPAGTAPFNTLTTRPAAFIVMTTTSKSW